MIYSQCLDEYYKKFTDSQRRVFEWVKNSIEVLAAIIGKSSLENGSVDSSLVKKTDVIVIDDFAMIDRKIFLMIEQLCKRFITKDGRYKVVMLFYLAIPHSYLLYQIQTYLILFHAKDATLSSILLKIRDGICDNQVASVLQSRIKSVDVKSVDLTRTVIICSRRNEVETINNECLKLIDGEEHQFEATDTDSNGQPLRETDQKRLEHINRCNNFKSWLSYSITTKSKYFKWMGQRNIV